jgi:hypothetical protein
VIEEERQLRQSAEERLQAHLIDLYNNTEVNQELRERLPRANKSDPLKSSNHETLEEAVVVETMEKSPESLVQRYIHAILYSLYSNYW